MFEIDKIELSSIESTAYWWVNIIKNKVRELAIQGSNDKDEIDFLKIFYNFTEVEWRKLYLELVKYITEDVNNYVPKGNIIGIDAFNQDTDKKRHDRINTELSKIINCSVPDIRLVSVSEKDSVIYTNMSGTAVWYKSGGTKNLPTQYEPCYILTGDENELHFYNLLISTIAKLDSIDSDFKSISLLREKFCKEYKRNNKTEKSIKKVVEKFNYAFNRACNKGVILGRSYQETYIPAFRDIDYIELENYTEIAEHYANVILEKNESKSNKTYNKKINSIKM